MGMLRRIEPRRLMVGTTPWAVDQLFASGEQGAWYDPSDMSTLFQDSAGTTPVTAVEQPVGLMLDKSGRGNHAIQATTTKRPVLSRRVNLLRKTEQFQDVAWGKTLCSVTPDSAIAPDGTLTADLIIPDASSGIRYVSIAGSGNSIYKVRIKNGGLRYAAFGNAAAVTVVDLDSGTISTTSKAGMSFAVTALGDGWYEVTCANPTATAYQYQLFAGVDGTGGNIATDGVAGIHAWGASTTRSTDAHLPYQRVNTATDYDAPAKYPAYTQVDGTDDALTSATGGGGTTGFFFSSAVLTTLGDAKQVLWSDAGTNTGYEVSISATNKLQLSVGTGATRVTVESAALSTNARYVLTAWHDGTTIYVRVNNSAPVSVACGVASAGTAGVTQFCENGASAGYFRGRSYGVVYRKDAAPGPATIDAVIRYLAAKSGRPV